MNTVNKVLLYIFLISGLDSIAQKIDTRTTQSKNTNGLIFSSKKGIGITAADSTFKVNLGFRIQSRATFVANEGEDNYLNAEVRRMRLKFNGFAFNPKFTYKIELAFSAKDIGSIKEDQNINILYDAVAFYQANKHFKIGFGQAKIPGNLQRITSSGSLQLTDRSINNSRFNIDRDIGFLFDYYQTRTNKFGYAIKTSITSGEGRNFNQVKDMGLAYTGKLEVYPFGDFTANGAYFEGDLVREIKPKLMLSGAFHFNDNAIRTQGQRGKEMFEPTDLTSIFVDAILKYQGWAFQTAFMQRDAAKAVSFNPIDSLDYTYAIVGNGYDAQLSYLFKNDFELIGRYSYSTPDNEVKTFLAESNQYSFGLTKYIKEHSFKLQTEVTNEQLKMVNQTNKENWYVRFQLEIGI